MNHASALDIFLIEELLGSQPRVWLSKDSYFKIPIFNILLKRMHASIKRENPRQAIRSLVYAYELVKDRKSHLLLFPEGKRYNDGKIHRFFSGFTILAKKLGRPVVPVAICGTHKIFPKGKWTIDSRAAEVKLIIGEPFFYKEEYSESEFVAKVQDWFTKVLEKENR